MSPERNFSEQLLRYLDGELDESSRLRIVDRLRQDPAARVLLREIAEQAVLVADLQRVTLVGAESVVDQDPPRPLVPGESSADPVPKVSSGRWWTRTWPWQLAAALLIACVAWIGLGPGHRQSPVARVESVTGASQYFGARSDQNSTIRPGLVLRGGDTLETQSCDAWIELQMSDADSLTLAGHSTLRVLESRRGLRRLDLRHGNLWVRPLAPRAASRLVIQTPALTVDTRQAQLDVQSSLTETFLRVNEGSVTVRQMSSGRLAEVGAGQQVTVAAGDSRPLNVIVQPQPIDHWACDLWQVPEVILGQWLPPMETARARLGAEPLLWPVSEDRSVTLFAVALAAWKSSERPVRLHADSQLRVRGLTRSAQTVRFGISTQKMRGVFAGKFEVDVPPEQLAAAGETWEVNLPLSSFLPRHPQLSRSPEALELTDVYALTIEHDAGLEVHHVELVSGSPDTVARRRPGVTEASSPPP